MQCRLFQGPYSSGGQLASSSSGAPNGSTRRVGVSARNGMVAAGMPVEMGGFGLSVGGVRHAVVQGAQAPQPQQHQYQGMMVLQASPRESCCGVHPGQGQIHMQVRGGPGSELSRPVWITESSQMTMMRHGQQHGQQHGHRQYGYYQHGHQQQQQQEMMHQHGIQTQRDYQHVPSQLGHQCGNLQHGHRQYGYYQHGHQQQQQMMHQHGIQTQRDYQHVPSQLGHQCGNQQPGLQQYGYYQHDHQQQQQMVYEQSTQTQLGPGPINPSIGYPQMGNMYVPPPQYMPQQHMGVMTQVVTGQVQGLASMPPPAAASLGGGGGTDSPMFGGAVVYMGVQPNPGKTPRPSARGSFPDVAKEMWQKPRRYSKAPKVAGPGEPAKIYDLGPPVEVPFGSYSGSASGAPADAWGFYSEEVTTKAAAAVAEEEAAAESAKAAAAVAEEAQAEAQVRTKQQSDPRTLSPSEVMALCPGEGGTGVGPEGGGELSPGAGGELPEFISHVEGGGGGPQGSFGGCGLCGGGPQGSYEQDSRQGGDVHWSYSGHEYSSACDSSNRFEDVGASLKQHEWQGGIYGSCAGEFAPCEQFLPLYAPSIEPLERAVEEWVTERKPRRQKWIPVPRRRRGEAERSDPRQGDSDRDCGVGGSSPLDSLLEGVRRPQDGRLDPRNRSSARNTAGERRYNRQRNRERQPGLGVGENEADEGGQDANSFSSWIQKIFNFCRPG